MYTLYIVKSESGSPIFYGTEIHPKRSSRRDLSIDSCHVCGTGFVVLLHSDTPFIVAVRNSDCLIASLLIEKGADVNKEVGVR